MRLLVGTPTRRKDGVWTRLYGPRSVAATTSDSTDDVLVAGDLRLDLSGHQAWVDGQPIHLSHLQFVVLTTLVRHAGRIVTHEQLIRASTDVTRSSPRSVRSTVSRVRLRLGTGPNRPRIEVQRSHGYRLSSPE